MATLSTVAFKEEGTQEAEEAEAEVAEVAQMSEGTSSTIQINQKRNKNTEHRSWPLSSSCRRQLG